MLPAFIGNMSIQKMQELDDARIIYRSKKPLGAVITGAEEVKNWCPYKGTVWICRVDNSILEIIIPIQPMVYGDWYFAGTQQAYRMCLSKRLK